MADEENCNLVCCGYKDPCREQQKKVSAMDDEKEKYESWAADWCQVFYCNFMTSNMKHVGYKVSTYFAMVHYLFIWLLVALVAGLIFSFAAFYTTRKEVNPALSVCTEPYSNYYMCPTCDGTCDFWYLRKQYGIDEECTRKYRLLVDNGVMWLYCALLVVSTFILHHVMIYKVYDLDDSDKSICSTLSKRTFVAVLLSLGFTVLMAGISVLLLFFNVWLESVIKRAVNNNSHVNVPDPISAIPPTIVTVIIQLFLNYLFKKLFKILLKCKCLDISLTVQYICLCIYDMFINFVPVFLRVFLYGNLVGDPKSGYAHIGTIRFQHCAEFGCLDASYYIAAVIGGYGVWPLVKCFLSCCCCYCCDSSGGDCCTCPDRCACPDCCKDDEGSLLVDMYVELSVIFVLVIVFVTSAGVLPLLAAVPVLYLSTREKAQKTKNWRDKININVGKVWLLISFIIIAASLLLNIAVVVTNSRFIQHTAYSQFTGHSGDPLNFNGYLDRVLPQNKLSRLIDINAFPHYNAHYLPVRDSSGGIIKNSLGEPILYLPFIDFNNCLKKFDETVGNSFTRKEYIRFIETHTSNNPLITYNTNKEATQIHSCFNQTVECRSRGFFHDTQEYKKTSQVRGQFAISLVPAVLILCLVSLCACAHCVVQSIKKTVKFFFVF